MRTYPTSAVVFVSASSSWFDFCVAGAFFHIRSRIHQGYQIGSGFIFDSVLKLKFLFSLLLVEGVLVIVVVSDTDDEDVAEDDVEDNEDDSER